jgi:hypothetical protein
VLNVPHKTAAQGCAPVDTTTTPLDLKEKEEKKTLLMGQEKRGHF